MITIGSCFSGIGGLELGLERSIPGSKVIWQCEQDQFCQRVLKKHWPDARLYDDIRKMDTQDVVSPTIMCGGFPCQDLSWAGKGEGIHGKKSGLWWYMLALIGRVRPPIIVLENVAAITFRGGRDVVGSLAELGYSCEWGVIRSGSSFGAPHRRARWFCVAYSNRLRFMEHTRQSEEIQQSKISRVQREESQQSIMSKSPHCSVQNAPNTNSKRFEEQSLHTQSMGTSGESACKNRRATGNDTRNYWQRCEAPPSFCRVDDGIPNRLDRLKALGNAVVPQCAEWIGTQIWNSGLLSFPE